jgi:hypothetical protein
MGSWFDWPLGPMKPALPVALVLGLANDSGLTPYFLMLSKHIGSGRRWIRFICCSFQELLITIILECSFPMRHSSSNKLMHLQVSLVCPLGFVMSAVLGGCGIFPLSTNRVAWRHSVGGAQGAGAGFNRKLQNAGPTRPPLDQNVTWFVWIVQQQFTTANKLLSHVTCSFFQCDTQQ